MTDFGYIFDKLQRSPFMEQFVTYLKEGKLMATKCTSCGTMHMPPREHCTCLNTEMEWVEVTPEATLKAFTMINFAPDVLADKQPYFVGIAETPEGLRMMGWLTGDATQNPQVGMKLKISPQELEGDKIVYKFTKVL
ncbi:MAG: Zn-ribbon domain-containing OB-fold protein [Candidatus Heimdallarchaeota archaeon]